MITDDKLDPNGGVVRQTFIVPIVTATTQSDVAAWRFVPGFKFEVLDFSVYALAVTATISVDGKIGSTSILTGAVTPVADTETKGTLVTARSGRRGSRTASLGVFYTTNGTGAATQLKVTVVYRPYPLNGETDQ